MYVCVQQFADIFCYLGPRLKVGPDLRNSCLFSHSKLLGEGPAMSLARRHQCVPVVQRVIVVERDEGEID
jgi:hypothetical protein